MTNGGVKPSGNDMPAADERAAADATPEAVDYSFVAEPAAANRRLDAFLAATIATVSRARIRQSIDDGLAAVDGVPQKASYRVSPGERISLKLCAARDLPAPDPTPLDVLFEDDAIAVINKPPRMVVHQAKGHAAGTLAGALVHHFTDLSAAAGAIRPGIVHRLDRDTSGVIVVAKHDAAHHALAQQFHDRTVKKEYLALAAGRPDRDADRVNEPIGPHPTHREKMALRTDHPDSRPAETFFEVLERYPGFALIRAHPKTGRTHQVRLHLAHIRCPVLCDKQYGSRSRITAGELRAITRKKQLAPDWDDDAVLLDRQALHAHRLQFAHPVSGEVVAFEAPLAADIQRVVDILRASSS
jgi:23S rRNA pseudouridine1911/1915/1917 synthase